MPEVTLKINNRGYNMTCDEGQDQRLLDLSHYIDSRLQGIAQAGAARNENHLLVLTALVLADEVYALKADLDEMEKTGAVAPPVQQDSGLSQDDEKIVADALDHLAEKIERVAARLDHTSFQIKADLAAQKSPEAKVAVSA